MFEIGAKYEFRMIEDGDEVTFWGTIETYEHPLIKLTDTPPMTSKTTEHEDGGMTIEFVQTDGDPYPGKIINVTSPNFISAVKEKS